jgi:hypothetical protein
MKVPSVRWRAKRDDTAFTTLLFAAVVASSVIAVPIRTRVAAASANRAPTSASRLCSPS